MSATAITQHAILRWIEHYAAVIKSQRDYLTELDAAIGDADHGANMDRGFQAVAAKLPAMSELDISAVFKAIAMTLISTIGGASGPLYGTIFLQAAQTCSGKSELSLADWTALWESAIAGVVKRGKAELNDKTMLDALFPALQALKIASSANADIATALRLAAEAAEAGMQATAPLIARKGRASYLGERSRGHIDPGAVSAYLLLQSAALVLAGD